MASLGEDLLGIVNKLQDLVFNTIGNDSLDLPQIVSQSAPVPEMLLYEAHAFDQTTGCRRVAVIW
jgi:hypothetical protein